MSLLRKNWLRIQKWLAVGIALMGLAGLAGCDPSQFRTQAAQVPRLVVTSTSDPQDF